MTKSFLALAALFARNAWAVPTLPVQQAVCAAVTDVVSLARADPLATPFCSSFLNIGTITTTAIATSTPPVVNTSTTVSVTTSTVTLPATSVVFETTTPTITTTSTYVSTIPTTTTSTLTETCSPVVQAKRWALASAAPTPSCFRGELPAVVSAVCQCFAIPSPTSTVTSTTVLIAQTTTSSIYTTITPLITTTGTITSTVTADAVTSTVVTSTTTTSTTTVTATFGAGLTFYQFDASQDEHYTSSEIDVAQFQGTNYQRTGLLENLRSVSTYANPNYECTLPGYPLFDCSTIAIVMQGYFLAPSTGNFTFTAEYLNDDDFYAWSGSNAEGTNWNNGNTDFTQQWHTTTGTASYELTEGEYLPVTFLWVNVIGNGDILFDIALPDGTLVTDTTDHFVPSVGCDGSTVFSP